MGRSRSKETDHIVYPKLNPNSKLYSLVISALNIQGNNNNLNHEEHSGVDSKNKRDFNLKNVKNTMKFKLLNSQERKRGLNY
jgi:hypothetical protein